MTYALASCLMLSVDRGSERNGRCYIIVDLFWPGSSPADDHVISLIACREKIAILKLRRPMCRSEMSINGFPSS